MLRIIFSKNIFLQKFILFVLDNLRIIVSAGGDSEIVEQVSSVRNDLKNALALLSSVDDIISKADGKATVVNETLMQWNIIKGYS